MYTGIHAQWCTPRAAEFAQVRAASHIRVVRNSVHCGGGGADGPPVYQKEKLGVGNELVKGLAISTFLVQDGWKEHGVKRFLHTTLYGELLS